MDWIQRANKAGALARDTANNVMFGNSSVMARVPAASKEVYLQKVHDLTKAKDVVYNPTN